MRNSTIRRYFCFRPTVNLHQLLVIAIFELALLSERPTNNLLLGYLLSSFAPLFVADWIAAGEKRIITSESVI